MPRSSRAEAELTKARITAEAVQQLSVAGATGTSLTSLATRLRMSKAGVVGPFRSREDLLLAAFDLAVATFRAQVIEPALAVTPEPGGTRLRTLIDCWVDYLVDSPFQGGCVLTSTSFELAGRPGPLRDRVRQAACQWREFLESCLAEAEAAGDVLPMDASDVTQTLVGLGMALDQSVQLLGDARAGFVIRRLMYHAVGIAEQE